MISSTYICSYNKYRITSGLKVETDIITNTTTNLIGRAVILLIMFVQSFTFEVTVFIINIIMCLTSNGPTISCIRDSSLILINR